VTKIFDNRDRTSLGTLSQSEEDFSEIGTVTTAGDLKTGRTMTTTTLGDGTLTGRTNMETRRSNIMSARSSKAERMGSVLGSARGLASARASARTLQSARVSIAGDFPLLTDRKPNPEPAVTLQLYGKEQPIPEGARSEEPPSHSIVVQPEQSFADVIELVSEMVGFKAVFEYRQEKLRPLVLHRGSVCGVRWYSARGGGSAFEILRPNGSIDQGERQCKFISECIIQRGNEIKGRAAVYSSSLTLCFYFGQPHG
jgi:hypothetical protein